MRISTNRHLFVIVLTVFLDLLGMSLVIPIAATLFLSSDAILLGAGVSLQYRTLILGLLLGAGPVVQFFVAPLMGAYADRKGRKPVLFFSVLVNAVGHVLFGLGILTQQLWLLFASRALSGIGAANLAAANSSIVDISTTPESKVRNFGLTGMALGLGFIFGPFLGGILSNSSVVSWFNLATPLWAATILALMNAVFIRFCFSETLRTPIHTHMSILTGTRNVIRAFTMPSMRAIYISSFAFGFGYNFFMQFLSVFLVGRFQFSTTQIGILFAYLGVWMAIAQGLLARYLSKYVSARRVIRWAPLFAVVILLILAAARSISTVYILLPLISLAYGVNPPNMTTIISDMSDPDSQGEVLGIDRAVAALNFGLPPILSGWAVALDVSMPMIVAAISIFFAWVVFMRVYNRTTRPIFHEIS